MRESPGAMANIRLALLFAVALVAVITPVIESRLFDWLKDRLELRKRLALNVLETKEIERILRLLYFLDRDAEIGELKVIDIMDKKGIFILGRNKKNTRKFSEQGQKIFEQKDCSRDAILVHFEGVMSSNLNTVLNVCKFVDSEWMSYCEDNIRQVHRDEQRLAKLGAKELAPEQVRKILDLIEDKWNVKFIQTSVDSLLKQSSSFGLEYCQPDAIDARESYLKHQNRILVSNLQNFDKALDHLFSYCAHYIRSVFEKSTKSITTEVKRRIRAALPKESARDWFEYMEKDAVDSLLRAKIYEDGCIENSCKVVGKSVANVKHIKRRAEKDLSESLDMLLGDEWTGLERDCFYYLSCYVHYLDRRKSNFCDEKPNNLKFLQITSGAAQWRLIN